MHTEVKVRMSCRGVTGDFCMWVSELETWIVCGPFRVS